MRSRSLHTLLVWLHAVTSIAWLSQALALFALALVARGSTDPERHRAAVEMAEVLDAQVLAHLANASAFTGFMLSALTAWGYFRSWWVLTKAILTVVQLALGIFVLSASPGGSQLSLVAGMIVALGFQAWLSMAKPWGRTAWARRPGARRPPTGSRRTHVWSLAVPWADYTLAVAVTGHPMPVLSLGTVIGYAVVRSRRMRRAAGVPAVVTAG